MPKITVAGASNAAEFVAGDFGTTGTGEPVPDPEVPASVVAGEHGPEVTDLPSGAAVIPVPADGSWSAVGTVSNPSVPGVPDAAPIEEPSASVPAASATKTPGKTAKKTAAAAPPTTEAD